MLLSAGVVSIVTVFLSNVLFLHFSFIFSISVSQEEYYLVSIVHCRSVRALGRVSYIDYIENLNIKTEMLMNPTKFKSVLWKIVQMGTLQKLQNSIQTLLIFWPVYPIHTNSLFLVIFVELPFCHFPPPNTSIRGKHSEIWLIFHLNILVFQTNGKQPYSFPVLSRFCNGLCGSVFSYKVVRYGLWW